jgi:hypothetical protein
MGVILLKGGRVNVLLLILSVDMQLRYWGNASARLDLAKDPPAAT